MSNLTKEQVMQLGDLLTIAVNSRDPNVKSILNQLLIAVALIEDLEEVRAQNPIAAMIKEIAVLKDQLADLKRTSQTDKVQKLLKDRYEWTTAYWDLTN
jgi:hypothetical protein